MPRHYHTLTKVFLRNTYNQNFFINTTSSVRGMLLNSYSTQITMFMCFMNAVYRLALTFLAGQKAYEMASVHAKLS